MGPKIGISTLLKFLFTSFVLNEYISMYNKWPWRRPKGQKLQSIQFSLFDYILSVILILTGYMAHIKVDCIYISQYFFKN
jgi:hypothetical protein